MLHVLRNIIAINLLVAVFISSDAPSAVNAQTVDANQTSTVSPATISETLARLPASEAVMYFDVQRLFTDALPRALGSSSQL